MGIHSDTKATLAEDHYDVRKPRRGSSTTPTKLWARLPSVLLLASLTIILFLVDTAIQDASNGVFDWSWLSTYVVEIVALLGCCLFMAMRRLPAFADAKPKQAGAFSSKLPSSAGGRSERSGRAEAKEQRSPLQPIVPKSRPAADVLQGSAMPYDYVEKPAASVLRIKGQIEGDLKRPTAFAGTTRASVARWNQAIDQAAKNADPNTAEALLRQLEQTPGLTPDTISYNSVIHACAKKGDVRRAEHWLSKISAVRSDGVKANTISYNIVMDACAKANDPEGAENLLHRMLKEKLEANVVSYATVIHARAKRGDVKKAEHWLRRMIECGVEPNVVCYNSLVYACGRTGDAENAERWVEEMETRGLEARVTTCTAVVDACAKSGDIIRAEKWMNRMADLDIEPNVVSYSAMIDACAKAGDKERAVRWHEHMLEAGVSPNAHSFSAVINACSKAGDVAEAEAWICRMEASGVPLDVVVYSGVIDGCGKIADTERALSIFRQMQAKGIKANVVAYASLARPFAHKGMWQEVEGFLEEMQADGLKINEYFLYAMLLSYANAKPRQPERAEACFRKALKQRVEANDHVLMGLGRAMGRQAAQQLASELLGKEAQVGCSRQAQHPNGPRNKCVYFHHKREN